MAEVCPDFVVPHRETVKRTILNMTETLREELKNVMRGVKFVSLTTDTWTSRSNDSYLIITGHWLTEGFERRNCTLAVKHLTQRHTAEFLAGMVSEALADLEFKGEVVSSTHDGAANIKKAMSCGFGASLQCIAHLLNLAVCASLQEIPGVNELRDRCRDITTFFNKSSTATADLCAAQGENALRVRPDVCTRWNSFYLMISRLVELKQPICEVLNQHAVRAVRLKLLSPQEWAIVEELVTVFKPVDDATKILSGENYSTLGLVHMVLFKTVEKIETIIASATASPSDDCVKIGLVLARNIKARIPESRA